MTFKNQNPPHSTANLGIFSDLIPYENKIDFGFLLV
jgi:hypothetical protein